MSVYKSNYNGFYYLVISKEVFTSVDGTFDKLERSDLYSFKSIKKEPLLD